MDDALSIVLVDKPIVSGALGKGNIVELKIDILGEEILFFFSFKDQPTTLIDIAHVAKSLSVRINSIVRTKVVESGFTIPCAAGCDACCYFLILLSPPEAIRIVEEVIMKMPIERREHIMQHCDELKERTFRLLPKHLYPKNANNVSNSEIRSISTWYTTLQQPCFFLRDNSCSIYEQRPIVCRDWLVTGSTAQCQFGQAAASVPVEMPLNVGDILRRIVGELEGVPPQGVFLHDIFTWYEASKELRERKWPAKEMIESFVEALHESRNSKTNDSTR